MTPRAPLARLLIACPDATGLVAAVSGAIADAGGNLIDAEQHTDREHGEFTMRAEFTPAPGGDPARSVAEFEQRFEALGTKLGMQWSLRDGAARKRTVLLAGPSSHCLSDLLWRWGAGELDADVACVVSNHDRHRAAVEAVGLPFHHVPVPGNSDEDRRAHEHAVRSIVAEHEPDLVVLARYMRVLSAEFVGAFAGKIINIHHSFLPAFIGSDPYRRAYERGVKLIGATSHFVTADLDEGPIIAQSVAQVTHHDSVDDLKRKGRDLERVVLAEAVRLFLEDKILVRGNKTIVFR